MLRITHPRPALGRQTALGVDFVDGIALLDVPLHPERDLALRVHGFTVEEVSEDPEPFAGVTVPELRDLAKIEGLDLPKNAKRPQIIAAFVAAAKE